MDGVDYIMDRARLFGILVGVVGLIAVLAVNIVSPAPPISESLANGIYLSTCCGKVVLNDGLMSFSGGHVRYKLFVGKTDLMATPDDDVVVAQGHNIRLVTGRQNNNISFWLSPHRSNMMNIYDAAHKPPNRFSLYGDDGSGPYDFSLMSR
jgi:hypothetical protein